MPGVISFTREVNSKLWEDKKLFLRLFLVTTVVATLLVGIVQQDQYVSTSEALQEYGSALASEGFDGVMQVGVLFATVATGGLNTSLSEIQQIYLFSLYLLIWLATIWLLRHRMAGTTVLVRDGLYNAGAPIVATLLLISLAVIQLLPMALGIVAFSSASGSGLLHGGIETGLFAFVALLLSVLSLYWVSSTFFAVIIATIPGTYPMKAIRSAGQIVLGQRLRLMLRLLWLALILVIAWVVILLPAVLLDTWIGQPLLPIVMLSVQILTSFSVIFGSAYVYLLYRKMIDEPAK